MNEKNIEVEVRGPLTKKEFENLSTFLNNEGTLTQKRERVFIDYSDSVEERTKDIRIRETNGVPEIILKLGAWGGTESREEISVKSEPNKFETLVRIFGELGFKKGIQCVRNSSTYDYKGVEFALIEVPNHSYFFEAEILAEKEKTEEAEKLIREICNELNLKVFSRDEFFNYIQILNKEANKSFNYDKYKKGYFDNKEYLKQ